MLYCWGSGRDRKLGTGSVEDEDTPVAIDALGSVKVARVECGIRQTVRATSTTHFNLEGNGYTTHNVVMCAYAAGSNAEPFLTKEVECLIK